MAHHYGSEEAFGAKRKIKAAVAVLGALVVSEPDFAAENWPDFVDHYIEQVRKTIDTTEMDGYLAVVKNPNGALLLERPLNEVASHLL